jgi:hypothetical protein
MRLSWPSGGEGHGLGKTGEVAEEAQFAGVECILQILQEQFAEQAREHAHRQEEAGAASDPARAVERGAAAWYHAMNVRMVLQGLTPGMEYRGDANLRAQMSWIGGNGGERLGGGAEQDPIDGGLVLEGDLARQRR